MKKVVVGTVPIIIVGLLIWYNGQAVSVSPPTVVLKINSGAGVTVSQSDSIEKRKQKIVERSDVENSAKSVPGHCLSQWTQISKSELEPLFKQISEGNFLIDESCENHDIKSKWVEKYYEKCRYDKGLGSLVNIEECKTLLITYRSLLIDKESEDRSDYRSMDLKLLKNKIFAHISSRNLQNFSRDLPYSVHKEKMRMVDALVERDPDDKRSWQAAVAIYREATIMNFGENSDRYKDSDEFFKNDQEHLWIDKSLGQFARKAFEKFPENPFIQEMYLNLAYLTNNPDFDEIDFVQEYPDLPTGYYQAAVREGWNGQNVSGAIEDVKKALALLPKDSQDEDTRYYKKVYKKTLAALENGEELSGIHDYFLYPRKSFSYPAEQLDPE